jgi:hypothetical protein
MESTPFLGEGVSRGWGSWGGRENGAELSSFSSLESASPPSLDIKKGRNLSFSRKGRLFSIGRI